MSEPPEARTTGAHAAQIAALTEIVGTLARNLRRVESGVAQSARAPTADEPAPWVWSTPPAAADGASDGHEDPRATIENWVAWYNLTFVGVDGGRSRPIPRCWDLHPGLAMEVAVLAHTWRAANVGAGANERDAQIWLHQWRPGFSERLAREWVHPDCFDGDHRAGRSPPHPGRFEPAGSAPDAAQPVHRPARTSPTTKG